MRPSRAAVCTQASLIALILIALLLAACGTPPSPNPGTGSGPAAEASAAADPNRGETITVPILNRDLTMDEIRAEIQKEGTVVVGNWSYTANDALIQRFEDYVKETYGVEVTLVYEGAPVPASYLEEVYATVRGGDPAPYDVLAIEENLWAEANSQPEPVMEEFLPSGLIPNADRVDPLFLRLPTAIGFQASATPGIVYNRAKVDFLKDWDDLADPRLKGRLTLPPPGDITCGGILMGLAASLGKDYKDLAQMREVIDFAVDKIGPNVLKYTLDSAEMQQLLRNGTVDAVGFWNSLARLEYLNGQKDTVFLIAESGQYLANGFMWIPKHAPHPVLAQIFINWRLSDDAQFPSDAWEIEKGPWAELHEGLLGASYERDIPEWFREDYYTYYPTTEQLQKQYRPVDWDYYAEHAAQWMEYYTQRLESR